MLCSVSFVLIDNWVVFKEVDWFCTFVVDRGLLKIMEEEFSGPPVNVSIRDFCFTGLTYFGKF